jgi:hypothetical protein
MNDISIAHEYTLSHGTAYVGQGRKPSHTGQSRALQPSDNDTGICRSEREAETLHNKDVEREMRPAERAATQMTQESCGDGNAKRRLGLFGCNEPPLVAPAKSPSDKEKRGPVSHVLRRGAASGRASIKL